ncbi:unnamed protein product [Cuscuta europaea]|uniref:PUM-HD domain-containing protein n=1 Tax=Cuscuta europaea TaxID=41803 RepID=A0A9P1E4L4_CUSEU|nr:unnamed protein product [Cuscuta europaea]
MEDHQQFRVLRRPSKLPAGMSSPTDDLFSLESAISGLSISHGFDGVRRRVYRETTPLPALPGGSSWGGSDMAAGWGFDHPPSAAHQAPGPSAARMVGQRDFGDLLGYCGAHQDFNAGPDWSWARTAAELSTDPNLNAAAAAAALSWPGFCGGEESSMFENGGIFDPFLLCKKPQHSTLNPKLQLLNTSSGNPISNHFIQKNPEIHLWNPKLARLNVDEIRGKILAFASDPVGCRTLQHNLSFWTKEEIEVILGELLDIAGYLIKNPSGSYLIQKLFSICSQEQRLRVLLTLTETPFELIYICLNSIGTRAMQKMLEEMSSTQERSLVMNALRQGAVRLACDTYGHLVISYCLTNFSFEFNEGIIKEITEKCFQVATHIRGCRMLQLCVENARGEARNRLVFEILANAAMLSEDPYGNYVVQHLLEQNIPKVEDSLFRVLEGRFAPLCCNKYSSNVVEKFFLKYGENSAKVLRELIKSPMAPRLLVDPFANYVIQKALNVATGHWSVALMDLIRMNASTMQSNKHGRKILSWIDSRKVHSLYM